MSEGEKTRQELGLEIEELYARLQEAEETLRAIRNGEVDALVVSGPQGEQVYTLKGADQTYRTLIEEMHEGAAVLSAGGDILYCNRCFADMVKTPLEQVIGSSIHRFIAPADQLLLDALRQVASPENGRGELALRAGDGTQVPVYLAINPLQIEDVPALCLVVTDLSEQKRMEEIVASERLARSILDQAAEAIVVCDENGRIIRASQTAHQLCGQNPLLQPFEALFPLRIVPEQIRVSVEEAGGGEPFSLATALQGERLRGIEALFTAPEGQQFSLLLSAGPLLSAQDEVLGCVVTLTDITERVRAEEALAHLNLVLRAVRNVNQLTTVEKDRDRLLQGACDTFIRTRGYHQAWMVLVDESGRLVVSAEAGLGEGFRPMVERLEQGEWPACARGALEQSEVVVTEDPLCACTDCPLVVHCGGGGALTVRLEHRETLYGLLSASVPADFAPFEEEQSLFKEVAEDIAFALHSIELEEKRKQAEGALRESREWLATTLRSIGDAVIATDDKGLVTLMNPVADDLTGWGEEAAIGQPLEKVFSIINEQTGERAENPVTRVLREGVVVGLANHTVLIAKDGTRRPIADSGAPIRDMEGNIMGTVMIFRDITERKRAEEARERLYEQVQRDAETKATLLNEVNHRVTNNLTAIMGLLQAERNRAEMADQDAYRAIMQNLINRVGGLAAVHRLLSAYEWAPLRLSDVAGQVVRFSLQMLPRHKSVFIDLTPSPVRVTPDQAHNLALVISELATNTVKHALGERDAVHIAVRIVLEDEDDMVRLEYRDDGPGYPEDVLRLERYGVGFELVQNVVGRSLRGELSLHNDGGAAAVIRFKAQADQKPGF
jgi:PAS domain S-box-containing protein